VSPLFIVDASYWLNPSDLACSGPRRNLFRRGPLLIDPSRCGPLWRYLYLRRAADRAEREPSDHIVRGQLVVTVAIRDCDRDREHAIDQGDTSAGELAVRVCPFHVSALVPGSVQTLRAGVNAIGPCVITRVVWVHRDPQPDAITGIAGLAPLADLPEFLRSTLTAEAQLRRFTDAGRRGVALRLGSLYGPEAASAIPTNRYNVHLHTHDAARALVAALSCPGGIYNVCDDTDPVSHDRFTEATGWRPQQTQ
jgi:hypothetical protein